MQDLLGIQAGSQSVPVESGNTIQPVVEVGPKFTNFLKYGTSTLSTTTTAYTTPSDKDFYLTLAQLSYVKDAANDNVIYYINVIVGGLSCRLNIMKAVPATANSDTYSQSFNYPIKIDRGTAISVVGAFTAGTQTRCWVIGGFILE